MKIAHLSDIHFGADDRAVAAGLAGYLRELGPDLVVISGDFTQRGRRGQFGAAAAWAAGLGLPVIGVPGNHDISVYAFWRRLLFPLTRFERAIGALSVSRETLIAAPTVLGRVDCAWRWDMPAGLRVVGLNSARRLVANMHLPLTDGGLSERQIRAVEAEGAGLGEGERLVVVMHHPIVGPVGDTRPGMACRGAGEIARRFAAAGVSVVMGGHLHRAYAALLAGQTVVSQAGTATSTRLRGEGQSFNWIELGERVTVRRHAWRPRGLAPSPTQGEGWGEGETLFGGV